MHIKPVKTFKVDCNTPLEKVLDCIKELKERSVIAVTSKIVSACEGRHIKKTEIDKYQLIKQEADFLFEAPENPYGIYLTIKNGVFIPSAGIDESNADNVYILYPSDVWKSAEQIWRYLRARHRVKELAIIITDSKTTMMRRGVTGVALSWCGLEPLYSYIGKPDIYRHPLKITQVNIVDALASSAVFVMGEGNEQTPMAIINKIPHLSFLDRPPTMEERKKVIIDIKEDLYAPVLQKLGKFPI